MLSGLADSDGLSTTWISHSKHDSIIRAEKLFTIPDETVQAITQYVLLLDAFSKSDGGLLPEVDEAEDEAKTRSVKESMSVIKTAMSNEV